jgi:Holliday junction resolvasome RuvABC endonuclease subunit
MKVLGLDLSLHCGWAIIDNGKRVESGTVDHDRLVHPQQPGCVEDYDAIVTAMAIADTADRLSKKYLPDLIYVEQTNGSAFRNSQKLLEFIHYAVLARLVPRKVRYIDTSRWRSELKIRLSKDQKKHNAAVREGKIRGKVTSKHLAVQWANQTFNLKLKVKDNNEADALAVAYAGYLETQKPKLVPVNLDTAFKP